MTYAIKISKAAAETVEAAIAALINADLCAYAEILRGARRDSPARIAAVASEINIDLYRAESDDEFAATHSALSAVVRGVYL